MRSITVLAAVVSSFILMGCAPGPYTSILYSDNYDRKKDQTQITIFPLGAVSIPGKWARTGENSVSGQYFFINADTVHFDIALNDRTAYEFNKQEMTPMEFNKAFYAWESGYFMEQLHREAEVKIVKEVNDKNYLIWSIKRGSGINSYYLYGLKRGEVVYNLCVTTLKWDEAKIMEFLENAYAL